MNEKQQQLANLDYELYLCEVGGYSPARVRQTQADLRAYLQGLCVSLDEDSNKKTTADLIDHISQHESKAAMREASLILLRALGLKDLLPENNNANQLHPKLVNLIKTLSRGYHWTLRYRQQRTDI